MHKHHLYTKKKTSILTYIKIKYYAPTQTVQNIK